MTGKRAAHFGTVLHSSVATADPRRAGGRPVTSAWTGFDHKYAIPNPPLLILILLKKVIYGGP